MINNIFQIFPLQYFIVLIVFAPFLCALFLALFGKNSSWIGSAGILVSCFAMTVVLFALFGIKDSRPAIVTGEMLSWLRFEGFSLGLGFRIDELSLAFMIAVALVGISTSFFALTNKYKNWIMLNLFYGSLMLILMADNFGLIIIGWILSGAVSYSMGKYSGATIESVGFLLTAVVLMNLSLQISNPLLGTLSLEVWEIEAVHALPVVFLTTVLLFVACLFRMGIFPAVKWLYSGIDDPIDLVVSNSLLTLSGAYLLLRIHFLITLSPAIFSLFKYTGIITIIISSIMASKSLSVKRTLALSTSFFSGLILLSIGFGGFGPAAILAVLHTMLKGAMSLTSGPALKDKNGGLIKRYPVSGWCFVISAFILAGVAPGGVFFAYESVLGIIKSFSTMFWLITMLFIGLMSFALLRSAGMLYLGRRFDFAPDENEYHPAALVLIVMLPVLSVLIAFIHGSPFVGGTLLLPFLEGTLPTVTSYYEGQKLSSGLLLFITAQPAIISAAVYAQRKYLREQKLFPSITSLVGRASVGNVDSSIKYVFEDVVVASIEKSFVFVASFIEVLIGKLSNWPVTFVLLVLILIMILGGN